MSAHIIPDEWGFDNFNRQIPAPQGHLGAAIRTCNAGAVQSGKGNRVSEAGGKSAAGDNTRRVPADTYLHPSADHPSAP